MSEDLPNLNTIIKLLKMTTSVVDTEALVAIRKANEQLKKFGGDWEALLRGKVTIVEDPFAKVEAPTPRRPASPPKPPPPPRPLAVDVCSNCLASIFNWADAHAYQSKTYCTACYTAAVTKPKPQPQPVRPKYSVTPRNPPAANRYDGSCFFCAVTVRALNGFLYDKSGGYEIVCSSCDAGISQHSPAQPKPQTTTATVKATGQSKKRKLSPDELSKLFGGF